MAQPAAVWAGKPHIKGSTEAIRMILLTFGLIGIQLVWGLEMTYCMPYLLGLGLSKSRTSLVWVAGPLSGLVMAPVIGALADNSKSRWGRRRPFMVGGALSTSFFLIVLAWASEIVGFFIPATAIRDNATIILAVLSIYAVDFAVNAVMWSCRSIIVDSLPTAKQQLGSAWASRMTAIGHLIGYAVGAIDMKKYFGTTLGSTQFKQVTLFSAVVLNLSTLVTTYAVTERVLISNNKSGQGVVEMLQQIFKTLHDSPKKVKAICWTQFWAWIGYFPFLFFASTWVGETYMRYEAPESLKTSTDRSGEIGRIGSMALIIFSVVTSIAAITLPWVIESPDRTSSASNVPASFDPISPIQEKQKPPLITAWFFSHFIYALAMFLAPMVTSFAFATALVALIGIPWSIGQWAPFTFMGVEINRVSGIKTSRRRFSDDIDFHSLDIDPDSEGGGEQLSGIYLGILNLFTTLPQFVGTFISTVVFWIYEWVQGSSEGPDSIATCLFLGALTSLVAAYATSRLKQLG